MPATLAQVTYRQELESVLRAKIYGRLMHFPTLERVKEIAYASPLRAHYCSLK